MSDAGLAAELRAAAVKCREAPESAEWGGTSQPGFLVIDRILVQTALAALRALLGWQGGAT